MLDDFVALSSVLTGEHKLDRNLADQYMQRVLQEPVGNQLENLLKLFYEIQSEGDDIVGKIRKQIIENSTLGPLAKQIIILWYTSGFPEADGKTWRFGSPEGYFSSLMWSIIQAHPPGLSGGYFGHWKYPPDYIPKQR
ncbi:sugar dehydrogenase complex small subunit [Coleofasciculus sp. FACHB-129]|uniref:sugar dehydrogenase complex small subunit n=1 Tax=Cyanophyceae TaxID=3028117 RepID=UPI0016834EB9|nr:sugar dehydrogenase complex small subunit [Coleofasciculus sp. FACHB-129]MBD1895504.1 hypothetical protein [Coleofasciculus sp. FACHB-129]